MKTTTKIILATAFIGTLGLGGVAKAVNARQVQSQAAITPQYSSTQIAETSDGDGEVNDATEVNANTNQLQAQATSNNRHSRTHKEMDDDREDQQEAAKLQPLAKITIQEAKQAAQTAVAGTASSVKLENENGNLVYEVVIGQQEVMVDAGNGNVLYTENINQEDEHNEALRPKSSIQVSDSNERNAETNDNGGQ